MACQERRERLTDLMSRYLDCARAGDWERAFGFMSDEIVLHVPGRSAFAGEVRGKEAVRSYLQAAIAHAHESKVEVELVEMLVGDERVALIVEERFQRPEGAVEIRRANVYRVRGELIDEVQIFEANQYEVDELFAE
jgi:uncharacterized protein